SHASVRRWSRRDYWTRTPHATRRRYVVMAGLVPAIHVLALVMVGLVPAIHVFAAARPKTWMLGHDNTRGGASLT
ncbi:MAG: hypothetical protein WCE72_18625, partial [Pseudolabrys sp.]